MRRQFALIGLWFVGLAGLPGGWLGNTSSWAGQKLDPEPLRSKQNERKDHPGLRQLLQRGNYAEAEEGYTQAVRQEGSVAAYLGLARVQREVGRYSDAWDTLEQGLHRHRGNAELLAERGELLYFLGRWEEAYKEIEAALKSDPGNLHAHWVKACLLRDQGELAAADQEVRLLVRTYTQTSGTEQEIRDARRLLIIGLAGAENARWHRRHQQFAFVLNEIYKDALRDDPDCWQAEYQAALLLLEKHNRADAEAALDKALAINPRAADVLVAKGYSAWRQGRAEEALRYAERALKTNPKHAGALQLQADVQLLTGDFAAAQQYVTAAQAVQPRSEAIQARRWVLEYLKGSTIGMHMVEKEVKGFCRTPGVWHLEIAELLVQLKQYTPAEQHYRQAIRYRPDLAAAQAGLGLLYWQLGREAEAQTILREAFRADPFHVRVANALKVLEHLNSYHSRETEHFVIKYTEADKVLAAWLADYLEQWFAEYQQRYGFAPTDKVLVEILASREMFSGRVLALPGLPGAAQGASTGPLLVIPSPQADGRSQPYNWASVVRHELTHVFNLQQSEYRVPLWLTEGLAVRAEGSHRFAAQREFLLRRYLSGTLYNLNTIARGYHNFTQPEEVILAYLQGWLYVEYLVSKYGEEVIPQLLTAYRQGLTTSDALRRVCGIELAGLEQGYQEYIRNYVRGLPLPEPSTRTSELEAAVRKQPDNADLAARLATEYLRQQRWELARPLAEKAWQIHEGHPAAALVLARLKEKDKDRIGAITLLETALKKYPQDVRLLRALSRLLVLERRLQRAIEVLEHLRTLRLADDEILETLAELYAQQMRPREQIAVLTELAQMRPDDLTVRKQLAHLYHQLQDPKQTAHWAEAALWIDVLDVQAKDLLLQALEAMGQKEEIQRLSRRYQQ
jgi:tetratricopeptide (TPR) repeat protein